MLVPSGSGIKAWCGIDPEVTNGLIQQAVYFLGIGARKHAFNQKLVGRGD